MHGCCTVFVLCGQALAAPFPGFFPGHFKSQIVVVAVAFFAPASRQDGVAVRSPFMADVTAKAVSMGHALINIVQANAISLLRGMMKLRQAIAA